MGDDLVISGSGRTAVATDELYASAQRLHELTREARDIKAQLDALDRVMTVFSMQRDAAPPSAAWADRDVGQAATVLSQIEWTARGLEWVLNNVADNYGLVERFVGTLVQQFTGGLLAQAAPVALTSVGAVGALGGVVAGTTAAGGLPTGIGSSVAPDAGTLPVGLNDLITNPATVSLLRHATQGVGDAALGMAGIPGPLVPAFSGAGVALAAGSMMRVGSTMGMFGETGVRLESSQRLGTGAAPAGFADRLSRIPDPATQAGAQVVVERYTSDGAPDRYEVYIGGTVDFSPVAGDEPFDMTSNIANAAGYESGAYESVAEAMALAGVDERSPVQFTGYSQGGATAALLAASGDYNTQGLASFGGPTGQVPIPENIPAVLVEHADDPVPALGGEQANLHAVIVQRDVFSGRDIPEDYAVPAHHLEYYEQTARLMDDAESSQVRGAAASLDGFTHGATLVSSTAYRFERVPEVSGSSGGR